MTEPRRCGLGERDVRNVAIGVAAGAAVLLVALAHGQNCCKSPRDCWSVGACTNDDQCANYLKEQVDGQCVSSAAGWTDCSAVCIEAPQRRFLNGRCSPDTNDEDCDGDTQEQLCTGGQQNQSYTISQPWCIVVYDTGDTPCPPCP